MKPRHKNKLISDERGETLLAYALLVALIAVICIPSVKGIASGIGKTACRLELVSPDIDDSQGSNWDQGHCWLNRELEMHYPGTSFW